jgi:hypothetical protein
MPAVPGHTPILPAAPMPTPASSPVSVSNAPPTHISFTDTDKAMDVSGVETTISAPKDIEHLEKLAKVRSEEEEEDEDKIKIGDNVNNDIVDLSDIIEVL